MTRAKIVDIDPVSLAVREFNGRVSIAWLFFPATTALLCDTAGGFASVGSGAVLFEHPGRRVLFELALAVGLRGR